MTYRLFSLATASVAIAFATPTIPRESSPSPTARGWPCSSPSTSGLSGSGVIAGVITERATARPLADAAVGLDSFKLQVRSGADGRFCLSGVPAGVHGLSARLLGFEHRSIGGVRVRSGDTTIVHIALQRAVRRAELPVAFGAGTMSATPGYVAQSALGASGSLPEELASADQVIVLAEQSKQMAEQSRGARGGFALRGNVQTRTRVGKAGGVSYITASPPIVDTVAGQGTLVARDTAGRPTGELPLRHTSVRGEVSGPLARTVVEQRYHNSFRQPIEAVYTFPLPSLAAVHDFVMRTGDRTIVGVVRPRAEAERIYADARARGQTASLLTQERPNIFTQQVANIAPGEDVTVRITYVERLPYESGEYQYVFPMVVGPRYVGGREIELLRVSDPGDRDRRPPPPEGRVHDDDRINPPVLRPGERSGHDISLTLELDAGLPLRSIRTVTHDVRIVNHGSSRRTISLAPHDSIPNRDLVVRWRVAGDETRFAVLAHRDGGSGYFTLTMQPPAAPADEQVTPREVTFILDKSGSMRGLPIELSKQVIRKTLEKMRPDDRFNLVYFASGNGQLWDRARPRDERNVAEARRFLEQVEGGGGTEMLAGLRRAAAAQHDPGFLQLFVFLTDGFVGEDDAIIRFAKEERGDARIFMFGVGSSVNRYLVDGVGEHGGGQSFVVLPRDEDDVRAQVGKLFTAIDSPVLVDAAIDWNGLPVSAVYPARIPDLYAGQPVNVIGRYERAASGTAYVTGRVGARRVRYPVRVTLPDQADRHAALAPTWGRHRIHHLSAELLTADGAERGRLEGEITRTALAHNLVSQFTAFVAVDSSRVVGDGRPIRVLQPVELPESVSYEGIFGEQPRGRPSVIERWGTTVQETESGQVRVAVVHAGSAGARAGLTPGVAIKRVNGARVSSLAELERALLQSGSSTVRVDAGAREVTIERP